MVITRTPYRVSLIGGGTDHPEWYEQHGGAVIGFALEKYCHLMVRVLPPYFEYKHRVVWSKIELVNQPEDVEHPAVKQILKMYDADVGLAIHHDGDLPAKSGMGSSSSFVVGLLHAIKALDHVMIFKEKLASEAIYIERNLLGETVGCQDQIFAANGGFHRIDFDSSGWKIKPQLLSPMRIKYLTDHLMLVFTGFQRYATEIEKEKIRRLNPLALHRLHKMVDEMQSALTAKDVPDIKTIARILNQGWEEKKKLAQGVSNDALDNLYQLGLTSGALGGKLLGAGGGGFFLFVVPPDARQHLKTALGKLIEVPISVDYHGSRVMVFEPNGVGHENHKVQERFG